MSTLRIAAVLVVAACVAAKQPNIVTILTDDQDIILGSTEYQPTVKARLIAEGLTFEYAFANAPVCCPSRSSIVSGRFTHNHGAVNNSDAGGCASEGWTNGVEKDALAVHMKAAGYNSLYAGKYLNRYGLSAQETYVPPGWTEWFGLHGNSRYYNYTVQDYRGGSGSGKAVKYGDNYTTDYFTDVLKRRSIEFLDNAATKVNTDGTPFFLMVGTPSAHAGFVPAPQYEDTAKGQKAKRLPTYNKVYSDRHSSVSELQPMTDEQIEQSDGIYRARLGTLRSVDDLVAEVIVTLEKHGVLDDTYIFYTSDHGFHLGELAMGFDKRQMYETDVRIPMFVRGPSIKGGSVFPDPVSHVDLAPTILDLASSSGVPSEWDGRSYKGLLTGSTKPGTWRGATLLQYFGESAADGPGVESCGANIIEYKGDIAYHEGARIPAPCDALNNTWTCIRRHQDSLNDIYCRFKCFTHGRVEVPCETVDVEYYDFTTDPFQESNTASSLSASVREMFEAQIAALGTCSGQKECQGLGDDAVSDQDQHQKVLQAALT